MDRLTGLLVTAQAGDERALTEAIRAAQPEVRRFLRHLVDPTDLDDATQDTFIRAYRALPRFRAESSGRTWLLVIARRAAADIVRRRVRERRILERAATSTEGVSNLEVTGREEHFVLEELVTRLDPERREAFVLTQLIGCGYAEAAEICGVPVGTIRSRVARARERLLEQVQAARSA